MNYIKRSLFLVFIICCLTSCENYFGDINENPNSPTKASLDVVLVGVEVEMADWYGGELTRFTSMLNQHIEGITRINSFYTYNGLQPSAFSTMWTNNYANILAELKYLKEESSANGYNHVEGIVNILTAFQLMQATDVWNDIPWSEALKGMENLTPTYDSQESIYNKLDNLLASAITLLDENNGGFEVSSDFFYNGDADSWKKVAYALQARSALHWSLKDADNYQTALNALQNSFVSSTEEMSFPFPGTAGNEAPMFRFNRDRTGDIEFDPHMRMLLNNLNDTARLALLDNVFVEEHPYFEPNRAVPMITYRELKFVEAECLLQTNGSASEIETAYLDGIRASFEHFNLMSAYSDYVSQSQINPGTGLITLEHIMTQKYIALYAQPEVYTDLRRTNFPSLTPTSGNTIPVRLPYSGDEAAFNNNTPTINIFESKVAWDLN